MTKLRFVFDGAVDIEFDTTDPLFESSFEQYKKSNDQNATIDDYLKFVVLNRFENGQGISITPIGLPGDDKVEGDCGVKIIKMHSINFQKRIIK